MKVAVLGASPNRTRYSNMALHRLQQAGHEVIPVNPGHREIEGIPVVAHLREIPPDTVHTLTLYIGAHRSGPLMEEILALRPRRVIFNPGAENAELAAALERAGIEAVEDCTLVMLGTHTF